MTTDEWKRFHQLSEYDLKIEQGLRLWKRPMLEIKDDAEYINWDTNAMQHGRPWNANQKQSS